MKKQHIGSLDKASLMVTVAAAALLSSSSAAAQPRTCNNTDYPIINRVVFDSISDLSGYIDFHQEHFIFEAGHGLTGIEEDLHRDVNKHLLGSVLVTHGVGGTAPAPQQDAAGQWFLPRPLMVAPFHRSEDEWGPMVGGWGLRGSNVVDGAGNVVTGQRFHRGHRSRKASEPLPGLKARNRTFWNIDSLPDGAIEYDCEMFNKSVFALNSSGKRITVVRGSDAIDFATTMVHESWHSTGTRHAKSDVSGAVHECNEAAPGPSGPIPVAVCNQFIPRAPRSHSGELVERQPGYPVVPPHAFFFDASVGPGSYQMGEEFACDLALHAADWVPLMVSVEADFDQANRFGRDYYTNINRFQTSGPFACDDVVHDAFREASGLGQCDLDGNVCQTYLDCDQSGGFQACNPPPGSPCSVQSCLVDADCPSPYVCSNNCCIVIK